MSVAQVLEIVPSDDSWVNDGFTAVVRSIKPPPSNAAKKFWKCILGDTTGSASINMTVFFAPKFGEGDQIDVTGQGIKRKEYNGAAEVSVGQKTEIHVVGRRVDQQERPAPRPAPAPNGHPPSTGGTLDKHPPVNGQTVGMAMKEAIALASRGIAPGDGSLSSPVFWAAVHEIASDIIRTSLLLEKGGLAFPVKVRNAHFDKTEAAPPARSGGREDPPRPANRPQPGPDGSVALGADVEEDVPF